SPPPRCCGPGCCSRSSSPAQACRCWSRSPRWGCSARWCPLRPCWSAALRRCCAPRCWSPPDGVCSPSTWHPPDGLLHRLHPRWDDVPMPSRVTSTRRRPPSLRDVAEPAGASNVVNDYPHVRDSTRERVRAAILEIGYRPQVAARQLRTGAGGIITLAVPSLMFSYFSDLSQHFIDEAQRRGQTVVLHSTSAGPEAERTVLEGFQRIFGDGVIFNPLFLAEEQFAMMQRTTQPTVFIGEHLPETLPQGSDYARIDNRSASYDATRHLLSTGRRHLAFLGVIVSRRGQQPHSSGILRRDGFLAALREEGLPAGDEMVQA